MAITEMPQGVNGTYVLQTDAWEELPDGRVLLVGTKGQSIPLRDAVELGLAKAPPALDAARDLSAPPKPAARKVHTGAPPVSATANPPPAPYGAERAPAAVPAGVPVPEAPAASESK